MYRVHYPAAPKALLPVPRNRVELGEVLNVEEIPVRSRSLCGAKGNLNEAERMLLAYVDGSGNTGPPSRGGSLMIRSDAL